MESFVTGVKIKFSHCQPLKKSKYNEITKNLKCTSILGKEIQYNFRLGGFFPL